MTFKISTGAREALATAFYDELNGNAQISLYGGTEVSGPDADASGSSLLCVITGPSAVGLQFESDVTGGVLSDSASQVWSGVNVASGTATWFRIEPLGDSRAASTTSVRLQGRIGTASGEMVMANNVLVSGNLKTIDGAAFTVPGA